MTIVILGNSYYYQQKRPQEHLTLEQRVDIKHSTNKLSFIVKIGYIHVKKSAFG